MEDKKGVTLVSLAVTIIVLLLLASITTYGGLELIHESQDRTLTSELGMIRQAILQQYLKYKTTKNAELLKGTIVSEIELNAIATKMGITTEKKEGYYRLSPTQLEDLGIKNAKDTYIVNYETGEVMNSSQLKTNAGDALYQK